MKSDNLDTALFMALFEGGYSIYTNTLHLIFVDTNVDHLLINIDHMVYLHMWTIVFVITEGLLMIKRGCMVFKWQKRQ